MEIAANVALTLRERRRLVHLWPASSGNVIVRG